MSFEEGFKPQLTDLGRRHPVTDDLPGRRQAGRARRAGGAGSARSRRAPHRGTTVMSGDHGEPLLVLDRVGKGRVAQLLSDQMWLWARGFEGGGPQAELLRRLAYWLMKEPDLEENDLRAMVEGDRIVVTRQSLEPDDRPVTVDGARRRRQAALTEGRAGADRQPADRARWASTACQRRHPHRARRGGPLNPVDSPTSARPTSACARCWPRPAASRNGWSTALPGCAACGPAASSPAATWAGAPGRACDRTRTTS